MSFMNESICLDGTNNENARFIQLWIVTFSPYRYFFPTYENDNLLCQLEDDDNDVEDDTEGASGRSQVIAEDLPYLNTILAHESVRKEILSGDIT